MPLIKFPPLSLDLHSFLTRLTYSAIIIILLLLLLLLLFLFITIRTSNNLDSRAD